MCRREKLAVVAGVAMRETLYDCNEGSNFLAVGAKYTLMAYIEDTSGAEGTVVEHNFTVPEMLSNYLDGAPQIDTTFTNRPTTAGVQVLLKPLRDGVATGIIHLRTTFITTVAELQNEPCVATVALVANVPSVINITGSGCELVRNTQYDVYVYIEDEGDENDGTLSAPLEFVVPSNEFLVNPTMQGPLSSEMLKFTFTPSRSGKMWAMIAHRENTTRVQNDAQGMITSLSGAKGGAQCTVRGMTISEKEAVTTILSDCDVTESLVAGSPYTLFVYVEDLSGNVGTLKHVHFTLPAVSNYFVGVPVVVAGSISTAGLSVVVRPLLNGPAWLAVHSAAEVLSTVDALKHSVCKSMILASGGVDSVISVSRCSLSRNVRYNVYAYVEDSRERNDGTLSAAMEVSLMSNEFVTQPSLIFPISPEGFTIRFSLLLDGYVWFAVTKRTDAKRVMGRVEMEDGFYNIGGEECTVKHKMSSAGVDLETTLSNCHEAMSRLEAGGLYTLVSYAEGNLDGANGTVAKHDFAIADMVSNYLDGAATVDISSASGPTSAGLSVKFTPVLSGRARVVVRRVEDVEFDVETDFVYFGYPTPAPFDSATGPPTLTHAYARRLEGVAPTSGPTTIRVEAQTLSPTSGASSRIGVDEIALTEGEGVEIPSLEELEVLIDGL
jgi:hypothetical protein